MRIAAIVAAATIGDGVFALPYVFYRSGWLLGLLSLAVLAGIVVMAHVVYYHTLERVGERERLLGLAKKYLGAPGFWIGFVAIVAGLLLTLVAYLLLGAQFIRLGLPGLPPWLPLLAFWLFVSLTVLLNDRHVVELELVGVAVTSAIIVLIFLTALPNANFGGAPLARANNLALPFGAILFSLAGWTSIEPAYEAGKRLRRSPWIWRSLALGTFAAAALYVLFVTGILGTAANVAEDTVSGLAGWPAWKRDAIAALGLLATWTVSMPISREIKNSLEHDLHWGKLPSRLLIIGLPVILVLAGLNNFLTVVGVVGGVFLSLQYLLIITVGRRALNLTPVKNFFLDIAAAAFVLAAVYSVYGFVVH